MLQAKRNANTIMMVKMISSWASVRRTGSLIYRIVYLWVPATGVHIKLFRCHACHCKHDRICESKKLTVHLPGRLAARLLHLPCTPPRPQWWARSCPPECRSLSWQGRSPPQASCRWVPGGAFADAQCPAPPHSNQWSDGQTDDAR